jgi:predicted RNA binding protein YcfA (HicA-like mRNA interferase family)
VKSVSGRQFCKTLEQHGWQLQRIHSSHHIYSRPGESTILSVPVHGNKDLKTGTLRALLRAASLNPDDL